MAKKWCRESPRSQRLGIARVITSTPSRAGQTLIDIGDLSHHQILLLKRPHWEFQFDYDSSKAAETRIQHFDRIVQERHAILAYHFPFPGLGHLRKDRDGYTWVATPIDLGLKTQHFDRLANQR